MGNYVCWLIPQQWGVHQVWFNSLRTGKSQFLSSVNQRTKWPFPIATLNYQRVTWATSGHEQTNIRFNMNYYTIKKKHVTWAKPQKIGNLVASLRCQLGGAVEVNNMGTFIFFGPMNWDITPLTSSKYCIWLYMLICAINVSQPEFNPPKNGQNCSHVHPILPRILPASWEGPWPWPLPPQSPVQPVVPVGNPWRNRQWIQLKHIETQGIIRKCRI